MSDVPSASPQNVPASVYASAFACPHCRAFTSQTWYRGHAQRLGDGELPAVWTVERAETTAMPEAFEDRAGVVRDLWRRLAEGTVSIEGNTTAQHVRPASNIHFSICFNCSKTSLWIYDRLAWPVNHNGFAASPDMPAAVKRDFEEAAAIVDKSPRGAAALLRLAVQKLCAQLGGKGKNINDDIATLVKQGLDPRIQQALDVLRVIGNNAVHPGTIVLDDDKATAHQLFGLLNLIVEAMITQPAHVAKMYSGLPADALAAITRRDNSE